MVDIKKLETILGGVIKNETIFLEAFTHRSYLNEHPQWEYPHNERLEFLGDAVLELIVTERLYKEFPEKPEGELTSLRAALVNAVMLGNLANELGFGEFLLLSRGEARDVGRARLTILANAFEAVVGALYLDGGYDTASRFIINVVMSHTGEIVARKLYRDAKSLFQEEAQERVGVTPTYDVIKEWGPDHNKHFVVGAYLENTLAAEGEGPSKQEAQQQAAEGALKAKGWG